MVTTAQRAFQFILWQVPFSAIGNLPALLSGNDRDYIFLLGELDAVLVREDVVFKGINDPARWVAVIEGSAPALGIAKLHRDPGVSAQRLHHLVQEFPRLLLIGNNRCVRILGRCWMRREKQGGQ